MNTYKALKQRRENIVRAIESLQVAHPTIIHDSNGYLGMLESSEICALRHKHGTKAEKRDLEFFRQNIEMSEMAIVNFIVSGRFRHSLK